MKKHPILIHFAELSLKGKNRSWFVKKLIANIKRIASAEVEGFYDYLLANTPYPERLGFIPGISWYAEITSTSLDLDQITQKTKEILQQKNPRTFKLEVKRSFKGFPLTSLEIARKVGQRLEAETGSTAEFENPDLRIYIWIKKDQALIFTDKKKGLSGLPVNTSGQGLLLFSGGIDSPVAGFLLNTRGMQIKLLHFHTFADPDRLKNTKIFAIAQKLARFQGQIDLFAAPYHFFQIKALEATGEELVLFRRFMLKLAQRIAEKHNIPVLITGDNLSQVASQTLENLISAQKAVSLPILRPLIGLDKQTIIQKAKKIQTYDLSIQEYKDCCSIILRRAKTKTKPEDLERVEERIDINSIIEKTLAETKHYQIAPSF